MPTIDLPSGTLHHRVAGPERSEHPTVVFVHAFLADGKVWSAVADLLAQRGIRSYAPDWPLGAHPIPLGPVADQSPRGVARLIADYLAALDLRDVTLVGNDTGGALVQFLLDPGTGADTSRIGRVVLTNCDGFDTFPPFPFSAIFPLLAGPRRLRLTLGPMRVRFLRHSPLGFGLLARRLDPAMTRSWIEPALTQPGVRDDAARFLRAVDPKELLAVSNRLDRHDLPVRIVWGTADRAFRLALGQRLQAAFRDAELVEVPGARTFVQVDAPDVLAEQIATFGR